MTEQSFKIEHIGLWVQDLELMKNFYETYFGAKSNEIYYNKKNNFSSYFLKFPSGETRLELMNKPNLTKSQLECLGYAHIAYKVNDNYAVDYLHEKLINDGYEHVNGPRITGDGYYEAVIKDPEGNLIEITS